MIKNLVIVESPAKAKTIERFLGKDFMVRSSMGHVMDLSKKDLGVVIDDGFRPDYEISPDKKKIVADLKKISKEAEIVWLATDEDREGEAISWHLVNALGLKDEKIKRIVFHEITKSAIKNAIDNPRGIDMNQVNAQQARRVLDRLVGFKLSPLLWKKVKPALSAGRVQSVAVRLIVEREEEIMKFKAVSSYRITAEFSFKDKGKGQKLFAELPLRFKTKEEAIEFLTKCVGADFEITNVETRPAKKSPSPPFTTSTLQQEAGRKLGFSVASTMRVAQQLYEAGLITYMRTDSVTLSRLAMAMAKEEITKLYGTKYVKTRQFTTKSKGAQEAHEAIRPTYLNNHSINGNKAQKKLYELIWKRIIASQMSEALLEKTIVSIGVSTVKENFVARGEVIKFDGFLKVYIESTEDENNKESKEILPSVTVGELLDLRQMIAEQRFTQAPRRYTEATLVKKMEELGIGRPSTYAPTISTIQKREYIEKGDKKGHARDYNHITLENNKLTEARKTEKAGFEKNKLFPTDLGTVVNKFLVQYFSNIIEYSFTASVEKEFDEIASGKKVWNEMIGEFYTPFHDQVNDVEQKTKKFSGERLLGQDPGTDKNVFVKIGRFGPVVQIGDTESDEKPKFAGLKKGQGLETITLEEALELFNFPRSIGSFEGQELTVAIGRYGPYVKHDNKFFSLGKHDDPATILQDRAIEIIIEKRQQDKQKVIMSFGEKDPLLILRGRYGPYISYKKKNYRIPKSQNPEKLSLDDCMKIIEHQDKTGKKKTRPSARK